MIESEKKVDIDYDEEKQPDQNKQLKQKTDLKCYECHIFGHLIKCYRCPVSFHKSCLGYVGLMSMSGPRGKWLCYFCKIVKFGIVNEPEILSCPKEIRAITHFNLLNQVGWKNMSKVICDIILAYKCSAPYALTIEQIRNDIPTMDQKQVFLELMIEAVPSDGK